MRKISDFITHILICVPKMNKGLTCWERHKGEYLMPEFSFLSELSFFSVTLSFKNHSDLIDICVCVCVCVCVCIYTVYMYIYIHIYSGGGNYLIPC